MPTRANSACLASRPGQRATTVGFLLFTGTVLALASLAAMGMSTAEAAFPGLNGRIACAANRAELTIPSPNPDAISLLETISINPDGTGETRLTNNATRDGDVAFSPDGTRIAFEGRRVEGQPDNSEIYVANNDGDLEGPDVRRLTFNNGALSDGTRSQVAATDRSPSWSPDSRRIVFHSGREATFTDGGTSPTRDFEIYSMDVATGDLVGLQRLTNQRGQDAIPHWSPDGSKITFQSLRASAADRNNDLEVFTMNPDGSGVTNVSNNPGTVDDPATPANENTNGQDSAPQFSPDGRQIVFTSTRSSVTAGRANFEIFKMNRDGSGQVRLTSNLSGDTPATNQDFDNTATWSPDGRRIVFTSGRTSTGPAPGGNDFVAYIMDSTVGEAAGLQRLTQTGGQFEKCDWQALPRPVAPPPPAPAAPVYPQPRPQPTVKRKTSLTLKAKPKRDRRLPFRYTFSGRVRIPAGVSKASVCGGRVRLTLKKGSKRVASGTAKVSKRCTYKRRITIRSTKRTGQKKGLLRVGARFGGNASLKSSKKSTAVRFF